MGLWDELGALAAGLADSNDMNHFMKAMMSQTGMNTADLEEKQSVLKFNQEVDRLVRERGITNQNPVEAYKAFQDALVFCNAQSKPDGHILKRLYDLLQENANKMTQPLGADYCSAGCGVDRNYCQECMALHKRAKEALGYLNNKEAYKALYIVSQDGQGKSEKCTLCGAPMEENQQTCDYCGTTRQGAGHTKIKVSSGADIPAVEAYVSKAIYDYRAFLFKHTGDYVRRYSLIMGELNNLIILYPSLFVSSCDDIDRMTLQATRKEWQPGGEAAEQTTKLINAEYTCMSEADVYKAAEELKVPVDVYLRGYFEGTMKCWETIQLEKYYEELRRKRKEANQRSREIERERQDKLSQIRKDNEARMMEQVKRRNYGYSGGAPSGTCCGTCIHYMVHQNECAYNKHRHPTGASDYCGNHRSR